MCPLEWHLKETPPYIGSLFVQKRAKTAKNGGKTEQNKEI